VEVVATGIKDEFTVDDVATGVVCEGVAGVRTANSVVLGIDPIVVEWTVFGIIDDAVSADAVVFVIEPMATWVACEGTNFGYASMKEVFVDLFE
jgi:hypothetical protein